jgi:hypothetical protein
MSEPTLDIKYICNKVHVKLGKIPNLLWLDELDVISFYL